MLQVAPASVMGIVALGAQGVPMFAQAIVIMTAITDVAGVAMAVMQFARILVRMNVRMGVKMGVNQRVKDVTVYVRHSVHRGLIINYEKTGKNN